MNKLIMIRHAPTQYNIDGIFMGRIDCDISESIDDVNIEKLMRLVESYNPSSIYSSPLIRCKKTASLIAPHKTILYDQRLMEKDLGDWSGKNKEYIKKAFPDYFDSNGGLNIMMTPPGGENFLSFTQRIQCFLDDAFEGRDDNTIVAVTHGGVIATMIDYFCEHEKIEDSISTKNLPHLGYFVFSINKKNKIHLEVEKSINVQSK